jgi:molybdate transport system ATP-binding protein
MKLQIHGLSLKLAQITLEVDISLQNPRTAIFGHSGAGKTSLLETIAGLRKPQRGEIRLNNELFESAGQNYSRPIRRRGIGYVPQYDSLFPHFSVRQNLLYGMDNHSPDSNLSFDHITGFLEIGRLLDRSIGGLSRGENQRVVVGRALLSQPRLLLLDEPLTALDTKLKEAILQQLGSLYQEFRIPILFVTHDPTEAVRLCDEVVKIEMGKVIARGSPKAILSSAASTGERVSNETRHAHSGKDELGSDLL